MQPSGPSLLIRICITVLLWSGTCAAVTPGEVARAEEYWLHAVERLRYFRFAETAPDSTKDPSGSGLIGSLDGPLTTSLGRLESKQASCQSGWCRVIAALLDSARVARGDTIALTMTGSYPAMDLAVLMVCKASGIHWRAVSSYGSSSWGANEGGASWPEMEEFLFSEGLLPHRSIWLTPGGPNDRFSSLPLEQVIGLEQLMKQQPSALHPSSLRQAVRLRKNAFGPSKNLKAYINVGGGHTAIGSNGFGRMASPGLFGSNERLLAKGMKKGDGVVGLLQYYMEQGLPVLHLTDLKSLLEIWDLPSPPHQLRSPAMRVHKGIN